MAARSAFTTIQSGAHWRKQHPIAIALRRMKGVADARVTETETLIRRGKKWFRYGIIVIGAVPTRADAAQ